MSEQIEPIRESEIELLVDLANTAKRYDSNWISRQWAFKEFPSHLQADFASYATPDRVIKIVDRLRTLEKENEELREELETEAEVEPIGPTHRTWPDVVSETIDSFGGGIIFMFIMALVFMPQIIKAYHEFQCK